MNNPLNFCTIRMYNRNRKRTIISSVPAIQFNIPLLSTSPLAFQTVLQQRNRLLKKNYCLQFLPPTLELYATPTPHFRLFACIAISPAHRVPCLQQNQRYMGHLQILLCNYYSFEYMKFRWSQKELITQPCLHNMINNIVGEDQRVT